MDSEGIRVQTPVPYALGFPQVNCPHLRMLVVMGSLEHTYAQWNHSRPIKIITMRLLAKTLLLRCCFLLCTWMDQSLHYFPRTR